MIREQDLQMMIRYQIKIRIYHRIRYQVYDRAVVDHVRWHIDVVARIRNQAANQLVDDLQ